MDALYLTIIGGQLALWVPLVGLVFKLRGDIRVERANTAGFKISYERELERANLLQADSRDAKLAAAIGLKVADAIANKLGSDHP